MFVYSAYCQRHEDLWEWTLARNEKTRVID